MIARWELETRHYHVTAQVSPAKLMEYGALLEGLYAVYAKTYDPESTPPNKLEVHVFNSQRDVMSASGAMGCPVSTGVGGFFVPSLLSIFVFEKTDEAGFPREATVDKTLAHDCSHQFLHVTCNGSEHVPTWEGIAVYFENGRFDRLKQIHAQQTSTLWALGKYLDHYGHISAEQCGEVYIKRMK